MTGHAGSVAVLATYEGTVHWSNWKLGAWDAIRIFIGPRTAIPSLRRLRFLQIGCSSVPQVRGSPANPKIFWVLPIFPHSPLMTVFLDGQAVKRLVDTGVDATVLTKTVVLHFQHWKPKAGPLLISGVEGQLDSKITTHPGHWKDLDGNQGPTYPTISTVP